MRGMKLIGLILLLASGSASAQFSSTITATSDYDFRGFSQTAEDPALQASLDWAHSSGFYVGVWGSNVDFGDCCDEDIEVDGYVGFAGGQEDGIGFEVGLVYYTYPGADDIDFPEIYAGLSFNIFSGKLWYSDDFANSDSAAYYIEANANFELPQDFGLGLHLGWSDGDYWDSASYADYSVGVTKSWNNFDFELKYVDSDAEGCTNVDVFSCDGRVIFAVATTLPWGKE